MDWRIQALSEQREKPIISIVIPVYNVDMFLRKALQSVADQTFQNYEAIIVDDGSTDRCPETVSYTHLDVYKRQLLLRLGGMQQKMINRRQHTKIFLQLL